MMMMTGRGDGGSGGGGELAHKRAKHGGSGGRHTAKTKEKVKKVVEFKDKGTKTGNRGSDADKGSGSSGNSDAGKKEMSAEEIGKLREDLPIFNARPSLMKMIKQQQFNIVIGETGSGKTTQLPQYLYEDQINAYKDKHGKRRYGAIAITQPRRVAAITVAQRVAWERSSKVGKLVGYSVRFDELTSPSTRIKYMTDGMLLREAMSDRHLEQYSVIVLDEAHERTVHTDVLFALVKDIAQKRQDLKVVVMSATLQADTFVNYFGGQVQPFHVAGRTYPVEVMYTREPVEDYIQAALITITQLHQEGDEEGDILVFLTGLNLSSACCTMHMPESLQQLMVCPMYGALAPQEQLRAFAPAPPNTRKVILATNIAETSITIHGIKYVVDPGLVKQRVFNARTGMDVLSVVPVSKAQARQRCGRAGRHTSGTCYRLYCERTFLDLPTDTEPEILRCNLSSVVLQLLALNVEDILGFDFITPPPESALIAALETLHALQAISDAGKLTKLGKKMAQFPVEPKLARTLLFTNKFMCLNEILSLVSLLAVENIFVTPHRAKAKAEAKKRLFLSSEGDHATLLKAFTACKKAKFSGSWCFDHFINSRAMRTVVDTRKQLKDLCVRLNLEDTSCAPDTVAYRKCLLAGFFQNIALLQPDQSYKVVKTNQETHIPSCILFNELVLTNRRYMRNCCIIDPSWLVEVAPNFFSRQQEDQGQH
ncbi:Dhx33 protein [Salpingoeca rosetta]|uniref:RNA helicase n=1 Tax=Salpingoeca rosetta (strain ATCC 50818 / BSB-021) TaxID=946362 RepID=F2U790_SALR5|nr:Dhx33 protein [Salpingoeca rosetta]EGD83307.1 Dhx33 protein [Salpingoeca rosetta]|eukprot:XP_004994811.1 Dhx33 protein [Salpingoeca rosetta]